MINHSASDTLEKEYQSLFWFPMLLQTTDEAKSLVEEMLDVIQDFQSKEEEKSKIFYENSSKSVIKRHKRRQQILGDTYNCEMNSPIQIEAILKSEYTKYRLLSTLKRHFLFSQLRDDELDELIDSMQELHVGSGDLVIKQGEYGDRFFILEEGAYDVLINDEYEASFEAPQSFGDLALMYNASRAATIQATEHCILWTLDRVFFRKAIVAAASNQNGQLSQFLSKISLFDTIGLQKLNQLARSLTMETYEHGQYIIKQGEVGDRFYIVRRGQVQVARTDDHGHDKYINTLYEGSYFGERALIRKEPRKANIIADGVVEVYFLTALDFHSMLSDFSEKFVQMNDFRVMRCCPIFDPLSDDRLKQLLEKQTVQKMFRGHKKVYCDVSTIYFAVEGTFECRVSDITVAIHGADNVQIEPLNYSGKQLVLVLTSDDEGRLFSVKLSDIKAAVEAESNNDIYTSDSAGGSSTRKSVLQMDNSLDTEQLIHITSLRRQVSSEARVLSLASELDSYSSLDKLQVLQSLSRGSFGSAHLCRHKETNKLVAVECQEKKALVQCGRHHYVRREIDTLNTLHHPFIVEYYGAFQSPTQIMYLLEFVSGGDLWAYLYESSSTIQKGPFGGCDFPVATLFAGTVLLALEHIHDLGYVYRSLKPENLLISSTGYLKLADFGFAKQVPFTQEGQSIDGVTVTAAHLYTYTLCGTPDYMAPELLLTQGHDKSVDFWAFGVLLYEMIMGETPFFSGNQQQTFEKIVHSQRHLHFPPRFDPHCKSLIRKLLQPNSSLRLGSLEKGVVDVKTHAFFTSQQIDFEKLLSQEVAMPFITPVFVPPEEDEEPNIGNGEESFGWFDVKSVAVCDDDCFACFNDFL